VFCEIQIARIPPRRFVCKVLRPLPWCAPPASRPASPPPPAAPATTASQPLPHPAPTPSSQHPRPTGHRAPRHPLLCLERLSGDILYTATRTGDTTPHTHSITQGTTDREQRGHARAPRAHRQTDTASSEKEKRTGKGMRRRLRPVPLQARRRLPRLHHAPAVHSTRARAMGDLLCGPAPRLHGAGLVSILAQYSEPHLSLPPTCSSMWDAELLKATAHRIMRFPSPPLHTRRTLQTQGKSSSNVVVSASVWLPQAPPLRFWVCAGPMLCPLPRHAMPGRALRHKGRQTNTMNNPVPSTHVRRTNVYRWGGSAPPATPRATAAPQRPPPLFPL
jgi:hypothetical protein